MSLFGDESNGDKLIEDYLSNFRSVRDDDDQFARPIEDEDIFGLGPIEQQPKDVCPDLQTPFSPPPSSPTTAKSKLEQFKQSIKDKLLAKGIVPKPLENARNKGDLIEMDAGQGPNEPIPPARLIFQHAQQKNVKDKYGLYKGQKLKWNAYSDHLKKSMCSDKRKQWDSFQTPADDYDDEEELVETVEDEEDCEKDGEDKEGEENDDADDAEKEDAEGSEEEDGSEESEEGEMDEEDEEHDNEEMEQGLDEEDDDME